MSPEIPLQHALFTDIGTNKARDALPTVARRAPSSFTTEPDPLAAIRGEQPFLWGFAPTPLDVYLELVRSVETHTRMLLSPDGSHMDTIWQFAAARERAEEVGLTDAEITAALQIGAYRGGLRKIICPLDTIAVEGDDGLLQQRTSDTV